VRNKLFKKAEELAQADLNAKNYLKQAA